MNKNMQFKFVKKIDAHTSLSTNFTKSLCIRVFCGAGKTWSMLVIIIYAICRGLTISMTAIQLG